MFHNWISIFLICKKFDVLIDEINEAKRKKFMIKANRK
ncbi:hypothetical protein bthur0014_26280 [Bacillus thuringiensis IBL 4222]|uniref:Uncharacterized protein n=1 Tax=Bacillus cereus (strain G9842) TaxID=405531 RepID=B7IKN7_BACC2|nr:hypothetical protein BCG9842_B2335 [Bacillus cereus G9842]EEM41359.1 hypothetical protein bthur0004_26610 [Bacillus thuringiensis serovar sotto str. T04001]EEN02621.1 hypothetical protein bthur0014_26280 [Bacillus thuringiensis IBL 4222]